MGYKEAIRLDSDREKLGLAIAVAEDINFTVLATKQSDPIDYITIQLHGVGTEPLTLTNLYIKHPVNVGEEELDEIADLNPNNHIITGDFNCHHTAWGSPKNDTQGSVVYDLHAGSPFSIRVRPLG